MEMVMNSTVPRKYQEEGQASDGGGCGGDTIIIARGGNVSFLFSAHICNGVCLQQFMEIVHCITVADCAVPSLCRLQIHIW